ncbi:MAG: hypothetical protein ABI165_19365 [Bryobacteraceae bacterium]
MKKTTVRALHLNTTAIVREVAGGEVFVIEKQGIPIAELRPVHELPPTRRLPDREALIGKLPLVPDSGRILEEDRS